MRELIKHRIAPLSDYLASKLFLYGDKEAVFAYSWKHGFKLKDLAKYLLEFDASANLSKAMDEFKKYIVKYWSEDAWDKSLLICIDEENYIISLDNTHRRAYTNNTNYIKLKQHVLAKGNSDNYGPSSDMRDIITLFFAVAEKNRLMR